MLTEGMVVRCQRSMWNFIDGIDVLMFQAGSEHIAVVEPLRMRQVPRGEMQHLPFEPTMSIPRDTAQKLMDELWGCGLRPSEGSGSAGALAATQRHLEDCRKLLGHAWAIDMGAMKP